MSISLDLSPELEGELSTEASRLNLSLSEYILHVLSTRQVLSNPPKTGAELVAYWQSQGVISSRSDITNSQAQGRHLRHRAETRSHVRSNEIYLESQGINCTQARVLGESLATFSEDWDSPEMSVYDNYDAAKTR